MCSPRITRSLVDAGADTTTPVRLLSEEFFLPLGGIPLAHMNHSTHKKVVHGRDATESQLRGLEATRRLLMRVEAVHAVSWLWEADATSATRSATEAPSMSEMTPTPLTLTLPILRRRAQRPGCFWPPYPGVIPKELANLRKILYLTLGGKLLEVEMSFLFIFPMLPAWRTGPRPPQSYGIDMRDWGGIPTEDSVLRHARARTVGAKDSGMKRPLIVKWLESITDTWHVVVPVVDDVTDILLLTSTADSASPLWWICFMALAVADIERLWLLFTLCVTMVLLPFLLWCYDLVQLAFVGRRTAARLLARVNCRHGSAPQSTFVGRLKDALLWVLVGSRSRCSPLWRVVGMSLDAKVDEADRAGVGFGAIDKWVARPPFSVF